MCTPPQTYTHLFHREAGFRRHPNKTFLRLPVLNSLGLYNLGLFP